MTENSIAGVVLSLKVWTIKKDLVCVDCGDLIPSLKMTKIDDGAIFSNGPCRSSDDKTFYLADTFQHIMWAYDYNIGTGGVANKRAFASSKDETGVYDGLTIGVEGCIRNAMVISGELIRYSVDGEVERRDRISMRSTSPRWPARAIRIP